MTTIDDARDLLDEAISIYAEAARNDDMAGSLIVMGWAVTAEVTTAENDAEGRYSTLVATPLNQRDIYTLGLLHQTTSDIEFGGEE